MFPELPLERFLLERRRDRLWSATGERSRNLVLVLDGVHDPQNLSAVVRSCDAFGLLELHVIESHARFRVNRKISQGCEKWLDIHRHPDAAACLDALATGSHELWLAEAGPGGPTLEELPWERPLALAFGNEHEGASRELRAAAAGTFRIPMVGFAESLNVSVAAGISLAVGVRERRRRLGQHGDLSTAERQALVAEWQRRSVRRADRILVHLHSQSQKEGMP